MKKTLIKTGLCLSMLFATTAFAQQQTEQPNASNIALSTAQDLVKKGQLTPFQSFQITNSMMYLNLQGLKSYPSAVTFPFANLAAVLMVIRANLNDNKALLPLKLPSFQNEAFKLDNVKNIEPQNLPFIIDNLQNIAKSTNSTAQSDSLFKDAGANSANWLVNFANNNFELKNQDTAQAIASISIKVLNSNQPNDPNYKQALLNLQKTQSIAKANKIELTIPTNIQDQLEALPPSSQSSDILSPNSAGTPTTNEDTPNKPINNPINTEL